MSWIQPRQITIKYLLRHLRYHETEQGDNCVGVTLGGGFYDQDYAFGGLIYGQPAVIAKVKINFTDGTSHTVVTDKSWHYALRTIQKSNIYTEKIMMRDRKNPFGRWRL